MEEGVAGRLDLSIAEDMAGMVRVAALGARPVYVGPSPAPLLEELDRLRERLIQRYRGRSPAEIEELAPARELYHAFGIDPTRTRPSSEALLRRVLQGKPLPIIANAVEVCTLLSLEFLLPMGLYDADRIQGPARLRRGLPGESYPGIRKEDVNLEGRPVLSDSAGAFGNPTSDSLRTSVTQSTRAIWLILFAPVSSGTQPSFVTRASDCLARYLMEPDAALQTQVLP